MVNSSSRAIILAIVFSAVVAGAVWLVSHGVDFSGKQQRSQELAETLRTHQNRMKDLYDQRTSMIMTWLDEQEAKKPAADAKAEAQDAAVAAEAQAAGTEVPASTIDPIKAQEELNAARAALEESRALVLQNQKQFDQFERLQNQISNYVAQRLLEQLREEAAEGRGSVTLAQIREFEQLEMEIANTRRDYHAAAFERNQLLGDLNALPFGLSREPTPAPVFQAERTLYEQSAGR